MWLTARTKLTLGLIIPLLLILSCSTVTPISTNDWWDNFESGHTKDEILRDFNLHRGKWWNHYARGCWLAEGGFWNEAISDFKLALKVRTQDRRAARSYGMHFWDYFGRRELGVCYYNTGRYDEAINELEESLKTTDSAKTKFYLNKARQAILAENDIDKNPPEIEVASFKDGDFVNSFDIRVKGKVKDDYFSSSVWINNRKLFIELASKELNFDTKVKLNPGENVISIKASDLAGNQTSKTLKITLDIRPPVILLDETPDRKSVDQKSLTLKGTVLDDFGIDRFWINDKEIKIEKGKEVVFNENVDISSTKEITLRAIDIAGNKVDGKYSLDRKSASLHLIPKGLSGLDSMADPLGRLLPVIPDREYPRLASISNNLVAAALEKEANQPENNQGLASGRINASDSPKITTDLKPITVYENYYVISGEVQDEDGVAKLSINDEDIPCKSAKHVFFNHILKLNEGDNQVSITAQDVAGNKSVLPPTNIKKKTFEFLETDSRYTVAMMPLKKIGIVGKTSDSVYPLLMQAFEKEPKRFNFVERDRAKLLEVLKEQKMSNSDLASTEYAIKIGKIRSAEGMLFGSIVEDNKSLSVSISLVDTETTKVLATSDVYGEDKSVDNMRWLMKGLALKIKQKFPMLQGSVVHISKKGFFVDFGSNMGAVLGMKFLLFREVDLGMMQVKEPLDAVAQIVQVDKQTCMAKIISGKDTIEEKDLVITK
ncbi:MAG: hypothetical protein ACUZ8O_17145 [Candidatus Anammoxibacter sp.]